MSELLVETVLIQYPGQIRYQRRKGGSDIGGENGGSDIRGENVGRISEGKMVGWISEGKMVGWISEGEMVDRISEGKMVDRISEGKKNEIILILLQKKQLGFTLVKDLNFLELSCIVYSACFFFFFAICIYTLRFIIFYNIYISQCSLFTNIFPSHFFRYL